MACNMCGKAAPALTEIREGDPVWRVVHIRQRDGSVRKFSFCSPEHAREYADILTPLDMLDESKRAEFVTASTE